MASSNRSCPTCQLIVCRYGGKLRSILAKPCHPEVSLIFRFYFPSTRRWHVSLKILGLIRTSGLQLSILQSSCGHTVNDYIWQLVKNIE